MKYKNPIALLSPKSVLITAFMIMWVPLMAGPECALQPKTNASAQGPGMTPGHAVSQAGSPASLSYPAERVFLQTDRDIYIAGESMHVKASLINGNGKQHSGIIYLVLRNEAGPAVTSAHRVSHASAHGMIYLHDTLPSGYYELIGFTNWMKNMDESHFFCKTLFIANRFDNALDALNETRANDREHTGDAGRGDSREFSRHSAGASEKTFVESLTISHPPAAGTREKLTVTVSTKLDELFPAGLAFSVSHIEATGHQGTAPSCTHSTEPYPETVQTNGNPIHFMERQDWILTGQITDSLSGTPLEGIRIVLNTPGNCVNLLYTYSDEHGIFAFALPPAYNNRELFLSPASSPPGVLPKLSLWDKFELSRPFNPDRFLGPEAKAYIRKSQDIVRAQKAFGVQEAGTAKMPDSLSAAPVSLYSHPVQVLYPDEYTPFDDLQEIAREIVPSWRIRRSGQDYRSSLVSASTHLTLPGSPVYFLDGLILFDVNPLIYLNSGMLERIEIHNLQWFFGDMEFPGIIGLFSKSGEYLRIAGELPFVRTRYGFDEAIHTFTAPSHENKNRDPEYPDLRQLLYWDPQLRTGKDGMAQVSFYTGDLTGDYIIRAEGVASDGSIVSISGVISVEDNQK